MAGFFLRKLKGNVLYFLNERAFCFLVLFAPLSPPASLLLATHFAFPVCHLVRKHFRLQFLKTPISFLQALITPQLTAESC